MQDRGKQDRLEAVNRVMGGEAVSKVAADLGKTERWVRKWVQRYDPKNEAWTAERSRAPISVPTRTAAETEHLVVTIRRRLMDDPWSQVGSATIAWELEKLGKSPLHLRTIERILKRAKVPNRRARPAIYVPKRTPYPSGPELPNPNFCHELDLVGPCHLDGAVVFHALNAVDVGQRRCGIEILTSKEESAVAEGLVLLWKRLGVPEVAKFDNGLTLQGRGRHLALAVWVCLAAGVRVRFIPFAEPWRNGIIEHFNDVFDKRFFRTEKFNSLEHLRQRATSFEDFHNSHHRYSALKGLTPDERKARLNFVPRLLDPTFEIPRTLPRQGQVEFIRLIRSDRLLKILTAKIPMPEKVIHRYVTATLNVGTAQLVVECKGQRLLQQNFELTP